MQRTTAALVISIGRRVSSKLGMTSGRYVTVTTSSPQCVTLFIVIVIVNMLVYLFENDSNIYFFFCKQFVNFIRTFTELFNVALFASAVSCSSCVKIYSYLNEIISLFVLMQPESITFTKRDSR